MAFAAAATIAGAAQSPEAWVPSVPRTWEDEVMRDLEVPLAVASASPRHVSAEYYYRMPVRPIYESYPIYHPDREPPGYLDGLANQNPEVAFDASALKTEEDWIRAGEVVFDAPIEFVSEGTLYSVVRSREWYEKLGIPLTKEGVFPFMRYVVRERGKVEIGISACGMCHTRVMPDGTAIKGAQGNFPDDRSFAYETRLDAAQAKDEAAVLQEMRSAHAAVLRRAVAAAGPERRLRASVARRHSRRARGDPAGRRARDRGRAPTTPRESPI